MINFDDIKIHKPKYVKILDISDNRYFSGEYSKYISNSKLSLINPEEGGSAEKYNAGLSNNKIYSNALEFGSAVHELVLQPSEFHLIENIDKPTGKPGFIADYLIQNGLSTSDDDILAGAKEVDYFHGILSKEKIEEVRNKISDYYNHICSDASIDDINDGSSIPIYLSSYDRYRCLQCLDSIKKNPDIQKLLYPNETFKILNEATFVSEINVDLPTEDGIKTIELHFKGKLDNFTQDSRKFILNDLKTTGKEITEFANSFAKYHYGRQIGLYLYFLKFVYPNIEEVEANILAVKTTKPFTSHVFPISLNSIQNGMKEASRLIKMVAFHEYYGYDKCITDYYGGF